MPPNGESEEATFLKMYGNDCGEDLDSAGTEMGEATVAFQSMANIALSCQTLNEPITLLTNDAMCTNLVPGLYSMWSTQSICSCLLILVMWITPCVQTKCKNDGVPQNDHYKTPTSSALELAPPMDHRI